MFSSRWATLEVPGMGSITGERCRSQARASWETVAPFFLRRQVERAAMAGDLAGRERKPRNEPQALLGAVVEDRLALAVAEIVQVLDAYDRDSLLCLLDLRDRHLGQADMADLALLLELPERAERLGSRHLGSIRWSW